MGVQEAGAAGGAAIGTGLAIAGANKQNRSIRRSMESQTRAAESELALQKREEKARLEKLRRDSARFQGLIRVNAAERGVGTGGSTADLGTQVEADTAFNRNTILANTYAAGVRTIAQLRSTITSLRSQSQDPLMAGLQGALSGASTGLSIGNAVNEFAPPTPSGNANFAPITAGNNYGFDIITPGDDSVI